MNKKKNSVNLKLFELKMLEKHYLHERTITFLKFKEIIIIFL